MGKTWSLGFQIGNMPQARDKLLMVPKRWLAFIRVRQKIQVKLLADLFDLIVLSRLSFFFSAFLLHKHVYLLTQWLLCHVLHRSVIPLLIFHQSNLTDRLWHHIELFARCCFITECLLEKFSLHTLLYVHGFLRLDFLHWNLVSGARHWFLSHEFYFRIIVATEYVIMLLIREILSSFSPLYGGGVLFAR